MKQRISLEYLSKYRAQFMGVAIILIMICHSTVSIPTGLNRILLGVLSICQCGVEIFMFLSGLGCYYSFSNTPKTSVFLKKRILKIFIPYIIVVAAYAVVVVGWLKEMPLTKYLWSSFFISFFTDGTLGFWFIGAILLLYLIFPALYLALKKSIKGFIIVSCAIALLCILVSYRDLPKVASIVNGVLVSRIPSFLIGMVVGKTLKDKKPCHFPMWTLVLIFCISAVLIMLILLTIDHWVTIRLLFLPLTSSGLLLLGGLMDKMKSRGLIDRALVFLGGLTFELYLIHNKVLATINEFLYLFDLSPILLSWCANILAIALAILLAWALQKIVNLILPKKRIRAS